ncbi:MAG: hypothetical protein D6689_07940 [Deltaproteobacteria bacterium]|nr:MAG: hypothetical protein D6689_07940 [Deltaproteobacteria bacterium]
MTAREALLAELVYECVRAYAELWDTTQYANTVLRAIEQAKVDCADDPAEADALVERYTQRAWERIARERVAAAAPTGGLS